MTRLALGLAVVLALAACGTDGDTDTGDGDGGGSTAPATSLAITVWPEGQDGSSTSLVLECDPPGGDHPAPDEACAVLEASPDLLEPLPDDVMCTQQFGGPEQAQIAGLHRGREVDTRYSRANGCEIARWDSLAAVFDVAPAS